MFTLVLLANKNVDKISQVGLIEDVRPSQDVWDF